MQKYLIAFILLLFQTTTFAQIATPKVATVKFDAVCTTTEFLIDTLDKNTEKIIGMSNNDTYFLMIWYSDIKNEMSVVLSSKENGVSCIIAEGKNARFVLK